MFETAKVSSAPKSKNAGNNPVNPGSRPERNGDKTRRTGVDDRPAKNVAGVLASFHSTARGKPRKEVDPTSATA